MVRLAESTELHVLVAIPSDGMAFVFHSFSCCKKHEHERMCAYTCTYMLFCCCPLLKKETSLIFVPQAQTGKDRACGAQISELQVLLSSKHGLEWAVKSSEVHHTTPNALYAGPVPPPAPPSEDIFRLKKNFRALQTSGNFISVTWGMMQLSFCFRWTSGEIQTITTRCSSYNVGTCLNQLTWGQ